MIIPIPKLLLIITLSTPIISTLLSFHSNLAPPKLSSKIQIKEFINCEEKKNLLLEEDCETKD